MKKLLFIVLGVLFFVGCTEDTTTNPVVKDIKKISIIPPSSYKLYVTDDTYQLRAEATYTDNSTADITNNVLWNLGEGNYTYATMSSGLIKAKANPEDNVSAFVNVYISYRDFSDSLASIEIAPITSISINQQDINQTGTYTLSAKAFYNDDTSLEIEQNNSNGVTWSVSGSASIVSTQDGRAEISFTQGEANVTVSCFDVNDTKRYNIN
jgi:hypothetical protein